MEETRYRELVEQERRDHELAVRLAQESNGQVEDPPPLVRRYEGEEHLMSTKMDNVERE